MTILPQVTCSVTGFAGFEREILGLRNANRGSPEPLDYLIWRYHHSAESPPPLVFWLSTADGSKIGMACAIFRPYHLKATVTQVAVIGDISLNENWRRKGLGQLLLRYMTGYLDEHFPEYPALVIPTESARRAFAAIGWTTRGSLSYLVYVLDPERYTQRLLVGKRLVVYCMRLFKRYVRSVARRHVSSEACIHLCDSVEEALGAFAPQYGFKDEVVRDAGVAALTWRYAQHPRARFRFASLRRSSKVCGLLVFDAGGADTCIIYDLFAGNADDLRLMLALFVLQEPARGGSQGSLRILLDDTHPARKVLRSLGFIRRPANTVFQVHSSGNYAERLEWRITLGDKDT